MTRTKQRDLVYLGWTGYGNYGDELLRDTWQLALGPVPAVPFMRRDLLRQPVQVVRAMISGRVRERLVVLGGGTTIGFGNWARHCSDARRTQGARGVIVLGAGAAEASDDFALGLQGQDWAAWRASCIALLGVRGPLTAAGVTANLRPTTVVGDPALLYPELAGLATTAQSDGPVVVSVGADPASRFDAEVVAAAVRRVTRDTGARIVVAALSPNDEPACRAVAGRLDDAPVHVFAGDVRATTELFASARLVVSERLHGAVAAVACGVPTVPLAYASKCDDFWLSVAGERPALRPAATIDDLVAEMHRRLDPDDVQRVAARVEVLRHALRVGVHRIEAWRSGATSMAELLAA